MEEIVNKIEKSGLIQVAITDYLPKDSAFSAFDLAPFLWEGLVLKEKDFRDALKEFDFSKYEAKHVYVFCSTDAILPSWAFILIASKLQGIASSISKGSLSKAKYEVVATAINAIDLTDFIDGKIIVKGCSDIFQADELIMQFVCKVQPVAKSIMFGEPCSTVPIFKRK